MARLTSSIRTLFEVAPDCFLSQGFRCLAGNGSATGRSAYRRFQDNPNHPSLRFKRVHSSEPVYSVRVGMGYRAVGTLEGDVMIWFWIGSHGDYDALLSRR